MDRPRSVITDIWFRSPLSLGEISAALAMVGSELDAENYWEWLIGGVADMELNISRTHTRPAAEVETRVMRNDAKPFSDEQRAALVPHLLCIAAGPISCGRWIHRCGEDFDLQVVDLISR